MPNYVVVGGIVECSHGGKTKLKSGNAKFKISGADVVTFGQETKLAFLPVGSPPTPDNPAACTLTAPAPGNPPSPCSLTNAALGGVSTKMKVGGAGVLLDTATGLAVNANDPAATWKISDPGQTIMKEA